MTQGLNLMPLPLMGEDKGEGEQGVSSTGPLSLALSHEGRGDLKLSAPRFEHLAMTGPLICS